MIKVDVFCPLYHADSYIDNLIGNLKKQEGVILDKVVFSVTESGDTSFVKEKILEAGFSFFSVEEKEFSHSLTRQKAIFDYCSNDIVILISQDVVLCNTDSLYELAKNVNEEVVYVYGKQICKKKNIEYYVRKKNYGDVTHFVCADDIDRLQLKAFFSSDAFAAYYRPLFIELNGYDNIDMMMNEDMYYSKKILETGHKKGYIATAVVEHSHKFSLKQLYNRYYQTGIWFKEHPEFDNYKTTDTGLKLAFYVLGQALKGFNIPVLFRWLPDMSARYFGLKKGRKYKA